MHRLNAWRTSSGIFFWITSVVVIVSWLWPEIFRPISSRPVDVIIVLLLLVIVREVIGMNLKMDEAMKESRKMSEKERDHHSEVELNEEVDPNKKIPDDRISP